MKNVKLIIGYLLGVFMIFGAVGHIASPEVYSGFIPEFLSEDLVNYASLVLEGLLGIGVFIPKFRTKALQGIFILMILFLPIHIIDLFRDYPVIGSKTAAIIRVPVQFLLIFLAWFANKK